MKSPRVIFLLAIALSMCSFQGMSLVPESNKKPIKAVLEFYPNYVGHLLGVAQIGYHSSYGDKHKESILPEDLKYLKAHGDLLQWSDGDEGILSYFFLTFPGYVNPASKTQLAEYLTDLNSAVANKSFENFKEKYKYYISELELWTGFNENTLIFDYSEEIQMISKIMMNNYDAFRNLVWPEYYEKMEKLATALNEKFDEWNLIRRWEKLTDMKFEAPYYRIILSLGMENGPTGKALGYNKDWYYYGADPKILIRSVCHEAGLRILSSLCSDKYNNYHPNLCFEVYKSLSQYLTDQIMADLGLQNKIKQYSMHSSELYSIFDLILKVNPDFNVSQLYDVAINTYYRTNFAVNTE